MATIWNCYPISDDGFGTDIERFADTETLPLKQFWDSPASMPQHAGICKIGWNHFGLCFLAILEDTFISTRATQDNQKFWELGDTCEFFIKPGKNQPSYREIHITPNDLKLEIFIPERDTYLAGTPSFEIATTSSPSGCKKLGKKISATQWTAELWVPWQALGCQGIPNNEQEWQATCSRYSYAENNPDPEYSSTAELTQLSFHRHEEFHTIHFHS